MSGGATFSLHILHSSKVLSSHRVQVSIHRTKEKTWKNKFKSLKVAKFTKLQPDVPKFANFSSLGLLNTYLSF